MVWRLISLAFVVLGILAMPLWSWSHNWSVFAPGFCWFVAILMFLVSIFARRGSELWRNRGQG